MVNRVCSAAPASWPIPLVFAVWVWSIVWGDRIFLASG